MPVVISYEGVETLGPLAHGAGEMAGQAQRQNRDLARLQQFDAQRNQTAAQLQGIQAQERQAEADRAMRRDFYAGDQQFQLQQQQQAQQQAMAQQEHTRQAELQQELMDWQGRMTRDQLQHQQQIERDTHQAGLGRWQGRAGEQAAPLNPGVQPRQQVQHEMAQYGHLLPWSPEFDAYTAAGDADTVRDQAETLTSLPTPALKKMMQTRPDDPYNPYLQAVTEARQAAMGGSASSGNAGPVPRGASPEAGRRGTGQRSQGGLRGTGHGDPLRDLTDQQLRELADNPQMLEQMMGGGQPQRPRQGGSGGNWRMRRP